MQHRVARELSQEIDRLLAGQTLLVEDEPRLTAGAELETARRLSHLVECLPPAPESLERRVRAIVHSPPACRVYSWRSAAWGALITAIVFLATWLVVPSTQQAWAGMLQALQLGQTRVELTPTLEGETRAVREPVRDLLAVELLIGRAPSLPRTMPEGYELQEIVAVSYPDLPSWIPQPFYVELCYGVDGAPYGFRLRQYRLLFQQQGRISGVQVDSALVTGFERVDVAGVPGTLLTTSQPGATCTVLWERDGLLLELETGVLSKDELLQIAQSVR